MLGRVGVWVDGGTGVGVRGVRRIEKKKNTV